LNKETIINTATSRFDSKRRVYVVESPLFERVIGVAKTEKQAWKLFYELLNDAWVAYLENRLAGYSKRGRPKKGKAVHFHVQVKPATKQKLAIVADSLELTQGELVDYLISLWDAIKSKPILAKALKGDKTA
jgi:hypothetical protein